jgi:hypothetical protein
MTRFLCLAKTVLLVLTLVCSLASFHATYALAEDTPIPPKFRLPGIASPDHYRLDLTIIPNKDTFTGTVDIDLNFLHASKELWLNANQLEIREAHLVAVMESLPAKIISTPKDYVGFLFNHPVGLTPWVLVRRDCMLSMRARSAARTGRVSSR